jgi:proteic killer suppression protein
MSIRSFGDPATADLFHGRNSSRVRRFLQELLSIALRKLDVINAAHKLDDLRSPPGNRLELLKGERKGFHSIRVNDQWRIVFRWENGAHEVSLLDYHR